MSAEFNSSVSRLGAGLMDKLVLEYNSVFWNETADWLYYISANSGQWVEALNLYKYTGKAQLMMFNIGSAAKAFAEQTDQQVLTSATDALRVMYPSSTTQISQYTRYARTNWSKDQHAKQSYSFFAPGSSASDCQTIAKGAQNRVLFAGEHTSGDYLATVHGAYISGLTAAKVIYASAVSRIANLAIIASVVMILNQ